MKLLLADDHTLFRDTLVQYIKRSEPEAEIALAKDFPDVMAVMEGMSNFDLVLMDLRMPGMNGLEGIRKVREKYPDVAVALMSGMAESGDVEAALNLGAVAYFPKTLTGKELLGGIRKVIAGEKFIPVDEENNRILPSYYDDKGANKNISALAGGPSFGGNSEALANIKLTPRETEVLSFLLKGASNKEIANALGLQVVTVKLHVRGVCRKLGAKNRTQAALRAKEIGFPAQ